jgi:preprotein translocase subunit SecA
VDEARTPLIIAKQVAAPAERYELAQQMGRVLQKGEHYDVDIKGNTVGLLHKSTC